MDKVKFGKKMALSYLPFFWHYYTRFIFLHLATLPDAVLPVFESRHFTLPAGDQVERERGGHGEGAPEAAEEEEEEQDQVITPSAIPRL